ncbi:MAG: hypothetical protein J6330_05910 [Clostridia bacterium]|nr:hypothetical protein [Clostridia bacterium]
MIYKNQYVPDELRPISAWGYFGYSLLFSIPLVGFVLLCVFALGGTSNVNLKSYARSYFCMLILVLIIVGIALLIMAITGSFAAIFSFLQNKT